MSINTPPERYERAFEIIRELSNSLNIVDILEIGCADLLRSRDGEFVQLLRQKGYDAIGLDKKFHKSAEDLIQKGILHECDIEYAAPYLGDRKFDLVLANRVMSTESAAADNLESGLLPGVANALLTAGLPSVGGMGSQDILSSLKDATMNVTCDTVLKNSIQYLKPGKYFVACETSGDKIGFSQETARNFGYQVIRFLPQEVILQKPL